MKRSKRRLMGKIRMTIMFMLSVTILRGPIFIIIRLLPRIFDYIFFVYPGDERQISAYLPQFMGNAAWFRTRIFFGGIITAPRGKNIGRGFYVGSPLTVRSMVRSEEECRIIMQKLLKIAQQYSIKRVAVAGRAPSIFMWHGLSMEKPFVHGHKGMVFCTIEALNYVAERHQLSLYKAHVVVFGAGRVGTSISDHLAAEGCNVSIIRAQSVFDQDERKLPDDVNDVLKSADIVIVISAKGSDFHPHMKHLKNGAIVIGETHPQISRDFPQGYLYRAGLSVEGLKFVPELATYGSASIPGCIVEAIVCAQCGDISDQKIFNQKARDMGFRACMVD